MTPKTEPSYLDYAQAAPASDSQLVHLQKLAEEQAKAEAEIARLDVLITKAREQLRDISERMLPELMDEIGITEFKTSTGLTIEVEETIRASIPKAKAPQALGWLKAKGYASLIKRVVAVSFGKGEDAKAMELRQKLIGESFEVTDVAGVHASTLSAWVREKLKKGEEIPLELLGVHRIRASKISI